MTYQDKQLEAIKAIEESFKSGKIKSTVVESVDDFVADNRIALTAITYLPYELGKQIVEKVIDPLKKTDDRQYFYTQETLHITINNVRIVNDPPHFNEEDIVKANQVFRNVLSKYKPFEFRLKRIMELKTSLAIGAFSEEIFGNMALEIRRELAKAGVTDDKRYVTSNIVPANCTITRFTTSPNSKFYDKVKELKEVEIGSFTVEKIFLITCNAACHPSKTKIIEEYEL